MSSLAELTDYYQQPSTDLPVEPLYLPNVNTNDVSLSTGEGVPTRITVRPEPRPEPIPEHITRSAIDKLLGIGGERYQLWPEKILREGTTAAGKVLAGEVPQWSIDKDTGEVHTSPQMIEKAQEISAVAGTGGLAGADATLGSAPFLRPALKYKDKLYKGKEGQQHMDVIPKELYPEFEQMAMSGEDISHYNFGFVNEKGHFLDREKALEHAINNGLIDPVAGQYGALTSTLMADSSKPGVAIESLAKTLPETIEKIAVKHLPSGKIYADRGVIHSDLIDRAALEHKKKLSEMNGEFTSGYTTNTGRYVSREEAGKILDALNGKNEIDGPIYSEHLPDLMIKADSSKPGTAIEAVKANPFYSALEHNVGQISQNKMTGDQWLGTLVNKPGVKPEEMQWTGLQEFLQSKGKEPVTKEQIQEHLTNNKVELKEVNKIEDGNTFGTDRSQSNTTTKYHSYQLSGGENYREMLLTLPRKSDAEFLKAYQEHTGVDVSNLKPAQIANLRKNAEGKFENDYKSSHWDEPNILAHVRMNDRIIDGKKSLHLEEIQSDWHQQGRDKGYTTPPLTETEQKRLIELRNKENKTQKEQQEFNSINERTKAIAGVPDAPFKKSWHELALKRMIREAAEKGYEKLSWTPGEAQAARYDLSKSIDELAYFKDNKLQAFKDGKEVFYKHVPENELPNAIGKEAAKKLLEAKINPGKYRELKGQDLKIGGEGMKGFYDQILPKALEKIGKEHGVKVKQSKIPVAKELGIKQKNVNEHSQDVHYIDIPQSLRDQALGRGFPLFSKGGHMLMPVDHTPEFEEDKSK